MFKITSSIHLATALTTIAGTTVPAEIAPDCDHHHHHSSYAPISIMGDHLHEAGSWMLSYRYMYMSMDDLYSGSDKISPAQVYNANYIVSPTSMSMDMHMIGAMYAPTDSLTLMAMLPYAEYRMDHLISSGAAPLIALNGGSRIFSTKSDGIGDLKFSALFSIISEGGHDFHGGLGVSLPTGSIGEKDIVPGPGGRLPRQLPAAMQVGSGSIDILPSLTYVYRSDSWSVGVQANGVYHTQTNAHDYRLGDRFGLDSWFAYRATNWLSLNAGLSYLWEGELSGVQSDLLLRPPFAPSRLTVPTAFGSNYGGQRVEAILGANFILPSGSLDSQRIGVDVRIPLWQDRNGVGLGVDYTFTAGWQLAF